MKKIRNTKQKGSFTIFGYQEKDEDFFVFVCLEFNIVATGDNPFEVQAQILNMASDHVGLVIENDLSDDLLNRHAPKKYFDLYEQIKRSKSTHKISSPYTRDALELCRES